MFSGLDTVDLPHGRRWTALTSFILQGILVSAALVLPLLHPANLPEAFMRHRIFVPISAGETPTRPNQDVAQHGGGVHLNPIIVHNPFTFPSGRNQATQETDTTPPEAPVGVGQPGGSGINSIFTNGDAQPVLNPPPTTKPRPISVVMEGNLIHRVEPLYPVVTAGEVRQPGLVSLPRGTTLSEAIGRAGGPTERGRLDRVTLVRGGKSYVLNLMGDDQRVATMPIRSGDQLVVGRRSDFNLWRDALNPIASLTAVVVAIVSVTRR